MYIDFSTKGFREAYLSNDCPHKSYRFHFIRLALLKTATSCLVQLHEHSLSLLRKRFEARLYVRLKGDRGFKYWPETICPD
jgi:hypothetical protein